MLVTVTLNAAIDRTLTVPNFQRGLRHRASQALTLAGGKGINVARALKVLGVPVVATGLTGGRTGTRVIEELTQESILNDFVRIAGESRTSTAVVDPVTGSHTEINEWGPHVEPEELKMLLEKLVYLSADAEWVIFAGTLPRGVDNSFYADAIKELARRKETEEKLQSRLKEKRARLETSDNSLAAQQSHLEAKTRELQAAQAALST